MNDAGPVMVSVPLELTSRMMRAVRDNPLTHIEDNDEWHKRLGWLICAWEVLLDSSRLDGEKA